MYEPAWKEFVKAQQCNGETVDSNLAKWCAVCVWVQFCGGFKYGSTCRKTHSLSGEMTALTIQQRPRSNERLCFRVCVCLTVVTNKGIHRWRQHWFVCAVFFFSFTGTQKYRSVYSHAQGAVYWCTVYYALSHTLLDALRCLIASRTACMHHFPSLYLCFSIKLCMMPQLSCQCSGQPVHWTRLDK